MWAISRLICPCSVVGIFCRGRSWGHRVNSGGADGVGGSSFFDFLGTLFGCIFEIFVLVFGSLTTSTWIFSSVVASFDTSCSLASGLPGTSLDLFSGYYFSSGGISSSSWVGCSPSMDSGIGSLSALLLVTTLHARLGRGLFGLSIVISSGHFSRGLVGGSYAASSASSGSSGVGGAWSRDVVWCMSGGGQGTFSQSSLGECVVLYSIF